MLIKKSKLIKVTSLLMVATVLFTSSISYAASNEISSDITQNLGKMGFSSDEIKKLPYNLAKEMSSGKLVTDSESYYRVSKIKTEEGKITEKKVNITKEQYQKETNEFDKNQLKTDKTKTNSSIVTNYGDAYTGEVDCSWVVLRTRVIDLNNSSNEYQVYHAFKWKNDPFFTMTDVIGLSTTSNIAVEAGTAYGQYDYDWCSYEQDTGKNTSDIVSHATESMGTGLPSNIGYAFKFDLATYTKYVNGQRCAPTNHSGFIACKVQPIVSGATIGHIYGGYSHQQASIAFPMKFGITFKGITGGIDCTPSICYDNAKPGTDCQFNID